MWPLINLEEIITLRTHLEMYGFFSFFFLATCGTITAAGSAIHILLYLLPTAIKNKQAKIAMSLTHIVFEKTRPNTTQ